MAPENQDRTGDHTGGQTSPGRKNLYWVRSMNRDAAAVNGHSFGNLREDNPRKAKRVTPSCLGCWNIAITLIDLYAPGAQI